MLYLLRHTCILLRAQPRRIFDGRKAVGFNQNARFMNRTDANSSPLWCASAVPCTCVGDGFHKSVRIIYLRGAYALACDKDRFHSRLWVISHAFGENSTSRTFCSCDLWLSGIDAYALIFHSSIRAQSKCEEWMCEQRNGNQDECNVSTFGRTNEPSGEHKRAHARTDTISYIDPN